MWSTTHASKRQCSIAVPTGGTINVTNGLMDGQARQQVNNTISVIKYATKIQRKYHKITKRKIPRKCHKVSQICRIYYEL